MGRCTADGPCRQAILVETKEQDENKVRIRWAAEIVFKFYSRLLDSKFKDSNTF
jgi:hypothetical protein